jgi:hypothetical protein
MAGVSRRIAMAPSNPATAFRRSRATKSWNILRLARCSQFDIRVAQRVRLFQHSSDRSFEFCHFSPFLNHPQLAAASASDPDRRLVGLRVRPVAGPDPQSRSVVQPVRF